jgi:hypothetical protein
MPTATLSTRVDEWLYSELAAGVTAVSGRVSGDGPESSGITVPYCNFSLLSSLTILGLNGTRIIGRLVYLIEIIAEAESWSVLETGADQIYSTLHQHAPDTEAEVVITSCVCEEEVRRVGEDEDRGNRYLGWRVRIECEAV